MKEDTSVVRDGGVVIRWIGGNCPVQAEGTFDGVPFYFRARGTSVTCEVGSDWCWEGPVYDWPYAGWIPEERGESYIDEAYRRWKTGNWMETIAETRAKNAERAKMLADAIAATTNSPQSRETINRRTDE